MYILFFFKIIEIMFFKSGNVERLHMNYR